MRSDFQSKYGRWALVACASQGLGAEFARQLAARGLDLVLVAETSDPLEDLAGKLTATYGVEIRVCVLDLGDPGLLKDIRAATRGLEIGLLVYNAAHSLVGSFLDQSIEDKLKTLEVNCRGPLLLADEFGRVMAARGRGGVLLLSSLAGFQGTPLVAAYAATKAFNLVLGEALWDEWRDNVVDVLASCPGATRTPGWERSRPKRGRSVPPLMEVEPVVEQALAALGRRPSAIAGRANRLSAFALRHLLSRRSAVRTMGRAMRSQYR